MSDFYNIPKLYVFNDLEEFKNDIKYSIANFDEIILASPFITWDGFSLFLNEIINSKNNGSNITILTSTFNTSNNTIRINDLEKIRKYVNKILIENVINNYNSFHFKSYVFKNKLGSIGFNGSSNLTKMGFNRSEINSKIVGNDAVRLYDWIDSYCENENIYNFDNLKECFNKKDLENFLIPKKNDLLEFNTVKNEIKWKDFQEEIFEIVQIKKDTLRNFSIILPTGTGKTLIASEIVNIINPINFLFISHRNEISLNALDVFNSRVDKEMYFVDENFSNNNKSYFGVINTIYNKVKSGEIDKNSFDMIIFDEAHRISSDENGMFNYILNFFNSKYKLALTATPKRMNGTNISEFFGNPLYEMRLYEAIQKNIVSPFEYYFINDMKTNISNDELSNIKSLDIKINNETRNNIIVKTIDKYNLIHNVKCLIFTTTIQHANAIKEMLIKSGFIADSITSEDTIEIRNFKMLKFKNGIINYLCVVDIFNEGIDIPEINTIFFMRPTNSNIIYLQQLGRGLRKLENKKLRIFDIVSNIDSKAYWFNRLSNISNIITTNEKEIKVFVHGEDNCLFFDELTESEINKKLRLKIIGKELKPKKCKLYIINAINVNGEKFKMIFNVFNNFESIYFEGVINIDNKKIHNSKVLIDNFVFDDKLFLNTTGIKNYLKNRIENGILSESEFLSTKFDISNSSNPLSFLYNMYTLNGVESIKILKKFDINEGFTIDKKLNKIAKIKFTDNLFIVQKGSVIKIRTRLIFSNTVEEKWIRAQKNGTIVDDNTVILNEDLEFNSLSMSANFISGGNASGNVVWKIMYNGKIFSINEFIKWLILNDQI